MTMAKCEIFARLRGSRNSNLDGDASPIIGKHGNLQEKLYCMERHNEFIGHPSTRRILH
jgi:hypothetical protein